MLIQKIKTRKKEESRQYELQWECDDCHGGEGLCGDCGGSTIGETIDDD